MKVHVQRRGYVIIITFVDLHFCFREDKANCNGGCWRLKCSKLDSVSKNVICLKKFRIGNISDLGIMKIGMKK